MLEEGPVGLLVIAECLRCGEFRMNVHLDHYGVVVR